MTSQEKPEFYDQLGMFACASCDGGDLLVEPFNQRGDVLTCPSCGVRQTLSKDADNKWLLIAGAEVSA